MQPFILKKKKNQYKLSFFLFSCHNNGNQGNINFIIIIFNVVARQDDCHISVGSA